MTQQQALLPVNVTPNHQDLPAAAEGLGTTDLQQICQSLDSSVSDNTRASYRSAWKNFERWAQARAALPMPASPALVASHLAEERRLSVATVRLHRAALAAIHKANGHQGPTDNEGVRSIMKGIARAHGRAAKQAKPLTAEGPGSDQGHSVDQAPPGDGKKQESAERASWRARVDLALLSILRDGPLRRSEDAALTWSDVELRYNGTALINVRRSKTDPEAEGITLYIGTQASRALQATRPAEELLDRNTHRSLGSHPARSDGESAPRQGPQAWAMGSPATAAAWAWPRTWPRPAPSCQTSRRQAGGRVPPCQRDILKGRPPTGERWTGITRKVEDN